MNVWDIVILLAVSAALFMALRSMRRARKRGCTGCCMSCGHGGCCETGGKAKK